jgi:hypothetical protein
MEPKLFFLEGILHAAEISRSGIDSVWVGNDTRALAKVM